jgi:hypothetical protein
VLHHSPLIHPLLQTHEVALPVAACPGGFLRKAKPWDIGQKLTIALGKCTPGAHDLRQTLELFTAHGSLSGRLIYAIIEPFAIKASSPVAASFTTSEFSNAWIGFSWINMGDLLPEIT